MKEWSTNDFGRVLRRNGYHLVKDRGNGSHLLYQNDAGNHISIPLKIKAVIARRLIKENNLNINV